MINIRNNIFETNSSSTHSIIICTKEEFENFKNYKLYDVKGCYNLKFDKKLVTLEEIEEAIQKRAKEKNYFEKLWDEYLQVMGGKNEDYDSIDDYLNHKYHIHNYDWYKCNEELEYYKENYITPKDEEVVAFGVYGNLY